MDWFTDGGVSIHKKDYSHIAIVNTDGFQFYEKFPEYLPINQLEATAILKCLQDYAQPNDFIFSDSTLAVNCALGKWRVKASHLIPIFNQIKNIILVKKVFLEWIPREQNLAGFLLEEKLNRIIAGRS
jgi:ribonuclease HI